MFNFGRLVVKYRKAIITCYLLLLVPSIIGYLATGVNYDMLSYMPGHLNSKQGEEILEDEFALSGLGLLMALEKKNYEIINLIDTLEAIDGIDNIVWLGDYSDIFVPAEFTDLLVRERFTSGDTTLLQIQFTENARSTKTNEAVTAIRAVIGDDPNYYFGGEPAVLVDMQSAVDEEIIFYSAIAVAMILLVLTMSCTLYLDPILFLLAVGVAIIINMGTNVFQGQISFVTASIAAVMQLGISLDYAIFLMHRFEEEKGEHASIEEAMVATINKTATTVSSSALTTIGGFAALMVMQNGIGSDMGLVLGKGILISLLVTLTFLPGLILLCYPFSSRFQHRVMLPSFKPIARWLVKYRWAFLIIFLIAAVPAYMGQKKVEYYYSNINYLPRDSKAAAATEAIMSEYGAVDVAYVIIPDQGRQREHLLVEELKNIEGVDSIIALSEQVDLAIPESIIPDAVIEGFKGGEYRNMMVFLATADDETAAFTAIDTIRETTGSQYTEYYVAGPSAMTRDMALISRADARNVAYVSVAAITLIIAISLKSLSLPLLMVLAVQLAIWINISFLYFQNQPVSSLTPIIIGAIQLGATVDYAILFTLRYKENLAVIRLRVDAIKQTIEDTGRSILTSALILFAATFSISVVAGIKTTREMTLLIGRGALISMIVMFTLLPALLLIFDKLIGLTTLKWPKLSKQNKETRAKATGGSQNAA